MFITTVCVIFLSKTLVILEYFGWIFPPCLCKILQLAFISVNCLNYLFLPIVCKWDLSFLYQLLLLKCRKLGKRKLGWIFLSNDILAYLKDSNAAAHSVDRDIFQSSDSSITLDSRGYFFLIDTDGSRQNRVNEAQRITISIVTKKISVSIRKKYPLKPRVFIYLRVARLNINLSFLKHCQIVGNLSLYASTSCVMTHRWRVVTRDRDKKSHYNQPLFHPIVKIERCVKYASIATCEYALIYTFPL